MSGRPVSPRWTHWRETVDLEEYHARFARMEAAGQASHGEADFIEGYHPASVLDAGCGMGRVAIELHHRGIEVVGADLDDDLLAYARADMPDSRVAPRRPGDHAVGPHIRRRRDARQRDDLLPRRGPRPDRRQPGDPSERATDC